MSQENVKVDEETKKDLFTVQASLMTKFRRKVSMNEVIKFLLSFYKYSKK